MKEIFGEISCWIVKFAVVSICLKQVLGGFFMAFYRIICMKRPDIALNLNKQRHIRSPSVTFHFTNEPKVTHSVQCASYIVQNAAKFNARAVKTNWLRLVF